jgi:dTDP-4-dehydrorhamnose reductase
LSKSIDYLILGSFGMLGHIVLRYLEEQGFNVIGVSRRPESSQNITLDVRDFFALERLISEFKPSYIVNCVGLLNEDAESSFSDALTINSLLPRFLENVTKNMQTKIIHVSTDCVFSGSRGSYEVSDFPDAIDIYGKTKYLGEINNTKDITIRTSIIGPDINIKGKGLYQWFMNQEGSIKGYDRVIWSGVTTLQLAKFIAYLFDHQHSGLIHYSNNIPISKFDLLHLFKSYFNKNLTINNFSEVVYDKSLISNSVFDDHSVPSYKKMISDMRHWIELHPELYSHYFVGQI